MQYRQQKAASLLPPIEEVRVEPRPSALNITLPAYAAERRLQAYRLSIDICCRRPRSAANQPNAAAAVDRRHRQTDGRTPDRYIDPAPHTMRAASIRLIRSTAHARYSLHLTVRRERCPPKTAPSPGGSCPHLTRGYLPPPLSPEPTTQTPSRLVQPFCRTHGFDTHRERERQTTKQR